MVLVSDWIPAFAGMTIELMICFDQIADNGKGVQKWSGK